MSKKCLYPGCKDEPRRRGNCDKHYLRHQRAVSAGETTWEELEQLELVLPAAPGQRSDYEETLRRARAKSPAKKGGA